MAVIMFFFFDFKLVPSIPLYSRGLQVESVFGYWLDWSVLWFISVCVLLWLCPNSGPNNAHILPHISSQTATYALKLPFTYLKSVVKQSNIQPLWHIWGMETKHHLLLSSAVGEYGRLTLCSGCFNPGLRPSVPPWAAEPRWGGSRK